MRYSTEPRFRKFVKSYGFLTFARKFGNKYGKKLMDTATKTGIDAAKTASKRVVQKTAEATGDLIGNKIADKITSLGKTKSKEKEDERQEIYIPPEKRQQIIDDLRLFSHHMKMEYQKITNLLDTTSDNEPRFITKKLVEVHDQSGSAKYRHKPSKQIRLKASMLRSDLCDFSDAYIVVKGTVTLTKTNGTGIIDKRNRFLAFKNNAPFTNCTSKINNVLIDNAEGLGVVTPMYNLLESIKNYKKPTGSLWNYCRDKPNNPPATDYNANESFKYKSSITEKTSNENQEDGENTEQGNTKTKKNFEIVVPSKHLTQAPRNANPNADPPVEARERIDVPTNITFKVTNTKLYVPVVTLSTKDGNNFLEQLKSGSKRTIKWNKQILEMINQTKSNN